MYGYNGHTEQSMCYLAFIGQLGTYGLEVAVVVLAWGLWALLLP